MLISCVFFVSSPVSSFTSISANAIRRTAIVISQSASAFLDAPRSHSLIPSFLPLLQHGPTPACPQSRSVFLSLSALYMSGLIIKLALRQNTPISFATAYSNVSLTMTLRSGPTPSRPSPTSLTFGPFHGSSFTTARRILPAHALPAHP